MRIGKTHTWDVHLQHPGYYNYNETNVLTWNNMWSPWFELGYFQESEIQENTWNISVCSFMFEGKIDVLISYLVKLSSRSRFRVEDRPEWRYGEQREWSWIAMTYHTMRKLYSVHTHPQWMHICVPHSSLESTLQAPLPSEKLRGNVYSRTSSVAYTTYRYAINKLKKRLEPQRTLYWSHARTSAKACNIVWSCSHETGAEIICTASRLQTDMST